MTSTHGPVSVPPSSLRYCGGNTANRICPAATRSAILGSAVGRADGIDAMIIMSRCVFAGDAVRLNRWMRLLPILAALVLPATLFGATPPNPAAPARPAWLTGQLLIAAPSMTDPRFHQTVLVMVRHNPDGAMAIVINRPLGERPMARILEAFGEKPADAAGTVRIYYGGPVQL